MKIPKRLFLQLSWVGWLNMLFVQFFFVRVSYGHNWKLLKWIIPLTGWINPYKWVRITPEQVKEPELLRHLNKKLGKPWSTRLEINKKRTWGKPDKHGVVEHENN